MTSSQWLDIALIAIAFVAAVSGWRSGALGSLMSFVGVVLGAVVANLVHWGIASINGMVVAAVCYLIGRAVEKK